MRTFILDIIPRIQQFSKELDQATLLKNHHWVLINEISNKKVVFIFRSNNQLLISENGVVKKAVWEFLGNDSLLIENESGTFLFKHGFRDNDVMALKLDSKDEFAVFVNETKYGSELNSIIDIQKFLKRKYILTNKVAAPKYFYLTNDGEFGPYTALELKGKVKNSNLNPMHFIRNQTDSNYQQRKRIRDIIKEI